MTNLFPYVVEACEQCNALKCNANYTEAYRLCNWYNAVLARCHSRFRIVESRAGDKSYHVEERDWDNRKVYGGN